MSLELYKKELDELVKKVTNLPLQDSLDFAHELFSHCTSLYINLAYGAGGKDGWKKKFNDTMQLELDNLYSAISSPEAEEFVNTLSEKGTSHRN